MSYLVRSGEASQDEHLKDIQAAKTKIMQIDSFMTKNFCNESAPENSMSEEDALTSYATLLSEKMTLQSQLLLAMDSAKTLVSGNLDVFVSDNKSMQDVARTGLAQSRLSMLLVPPLPMQGLEATMSHAVARTEIGCILKNLKQITHSNYVASKDNALQEEYSKLCQQLATENLSFQQKLSPVLEEKIKSLAGVLFHCDKESDDNSQGGHFEIFSQELQHVANKYLDIRGYGNGANGDLDSSVEMLYSQHFSNHLQHIVKEHLHKTLKDIECQSQNLSEESKREKRLNSELEKERTSLLLQTGFILAQISLVQGLSSYFTDTTENKPTSSSAKKRGYLPRCSSLPALSPSFDHDEEIATVLAQGAASRNMLASFLLNNTSHGNNSSTDTITWQEEITNLAKQLVDTDLQISKHRQIAPDYTNLIVKEAVAQAQMSYFHCYLKLQHEHKLDDLRVQLEGSKVADHAEQQKELNDMEDQIERLQYQLDDAHKHLQDSDKHIQDITVDFQSELERKENNFRQEVQALKDGYEIRIRSLQVDLDVAQNDLIKLQQEKEQEVHQCKESLHLSVQGYESKLEQLQTDKEIEISSCTKTISDLEEELYQAKSHHRKEAEEAQSLSHVNMDDSSVFGDRNVSVSQDELEGMKEKAEQVNILRLQLEGEKRKHMNELERLQQALQGDSNAAAQALLSSKIQQLEEQIQNMQHDYEQELSVQKSAHRRELARSRDDMMQLLSSAEAKSIQIDEDMIGKKYMKELDKIKNMYDRSFGAMEKSHQKVIMQMRKAHKSELDRLRHEKDQVLGEETRATQAALDAMRKAHESELQKERNKFLDVIAKTFSQRDVETLQRQHEEDLDLIQKELQDLSEQYSLKCFEKVSMEERLEAQTKALHQSRKRIQDLMASRDDLNTRNKHEIEKLKRQVFLGSTSSSTNNSPESGDIQMQLKVKSAEIHQLNDEISMLKDQLTGTAEELDESMNKYLELNSIHSVSEQRHAREVEELRRQVQEHASLAATMSEDSFSVDSSGSGTPDIQDDSGRSSRWTVIGSDIMTSTPFRNGSLTPVASDNTLASDSSEGALGRKLPPVTPEMRTAKKALWRQKQPQRARSSPGLTGSMSLTLQKQFSVDNVPSAQFPFIPAQKSPRLLKPRLSFDMGRASDEKL